MGWKNDEREYVLGGKTTVIDFMQASSPTVQSRAQLPPSYDHPFTPEADTAPQPDASHIVPPQTPSSDVQSSVAMYQSTDTSTPDVPQPPPPPLPEAPEGRPFRQRRPLIAMENGLPQYMLATQFTMCNPCCIY